MQPLQGKNWFLLASQPRGGAPLTLGYYMQPLSGQKPEPQVLICRMDLFFSDMHVLGNSPGNIPPPGRAWRYLIAELSAHYPGETPQAPGN
jgi:hypothetical protein